MDDYLSLFDYQLPKEQIATLPASPRDHCRLLVLDRQTSQINHHRFFDLPKLLKPGDVLVLNDTQVFPARLLGIKRNSDTSAELLLLRQLTPNSFLAIGRPNLKLGTEINFSSTFSTIITAKNKDGRLEATFNQSGASLTQAILDHGHTPLPHYIDSQLNETSLRKKYQTIYAKHQGSAAAPTAGLHFTKRLLQQLKDQGVQLAFVTLHVGLGTFQNLRPEQLTSGKLHQEFFHLSEEAATLLNQAKAQGRRIIAVGTTTTRVLESVTNDQGLLKAQSGSTNLFIRPPYNFKFVDGLITNFHLPKSSLLMLVSAFTSYPNTKSKFTNFQDSTLGRAYHQAITQNYRFFSFGDAMLIV